MRSIAVLLLIAVAFAGVSEAKRGDTFDPTELYDVNSVLGHLEALQTIASANNDNRAVVGTGYNASVEYVVATLRKETNYTITVQPFSFTKQVQLASPTFAQVAPEAITYQDFVDFRMMGGSGAGDVTALIGYQGEGCDTSDFDGFAAGNIALLNRGNCDFSQKVDNAVAAGASAVLIYNYESEGAFSGSMDPKNVPTLGLSNSVGRSLAEADPTPEVRVTTDTEIQTIYTANVIAETLTGDAESVVVVGSHLDSVEAGPGINDNGSGSASNLEMARQFMSVSSPNRVRFCWWAAEEEGLLGSTYYVNDLVENNAISKVALNLNYDMLGSPNFFRGVYDGAGADLDIRAGSVKIQQLFQDYFVFNNLEFSLTPFDGRSDYGPFIANGVPAGGLFSGAEVIKTPEERIIFGGIANASYDTCYHQGCDSVYNIDVTCLDEMGKAGYYVLVQLAEQSNLRGFLNGDAAAVDQAPAKPFEFRGGSRLIR